MRKKGFYELFNEILRHYKAYDLQEIRDVINKEINRELRNRKLMGLPIKEKIPAGCKFSARPIPEKKKRYAQRIKYIQFILDQNWRFLFEGCKLDKDPRYYVYAHVDPSVKEFDLSGKLNIIGFPFYIGKGTEGRAWDLNRNQGHGIKIREMQSKGYSSEQIVNIVRPNLSELEALVLETKLIYLFQTVYEDQVNGVLYNMDISRRPTFLETEDAHQVEPTAVIIRRKAEQNTAIDATGTA